MAQYVYRFPPCPVYDMECIENWIENQALNGLKLVKYNAFGLFIFEKSEPQSVRCRLEAAQENHTLWDNSGPPPQKVELAQEFGWSFVTSCGGFYIFQTNDPYAQELNTDPCIQALTLKILKKRWRNSVIFILIYLSVLLFGIGPGFFFFLTSYNSVFLILMLLFLIIDTVTRFSGLLHISRLYRCLSSGQPLTHKTRRNRNEKVYPFCQYATYVLAVAMLISIAHYHMLQLGLGEYPLVEYPGTPPFVTLEELAPVDTEITYSKIDNSYYQSRPDLLIPVNLYWLDGGQISYPGGEFTAGLLEIHYCETALPWLARAIGRDYLDYYRMIGRAEITLLPKLDVDYAATITDSYGLERIVLVEGNTVVCTRFSLADAHGNFTIESWAQAMAQRLLSEGGM